MQLDESNQRLWDVFRAEAQEHISILSEGFLELEKHASLRPEQLLEKLSREAHTFKGAARAVEKFDIEEICAVLENTLAFWKDQKSSPSKEQFDLLYSALDLINSCMIRTVSDTEIQNIVSGLNSAMYSHKHSTVESLQPGVEQKPSDTFEQHVDPHTVSGRDFLSGLVKVHSRQLNALISEAQEMVTGRASLLESLNALRHTVTQLATLCKTAKEFSGIFGKFTSVDSSGTASKQRNEQIINAIGFEHYQEVCHGLEELRNQLDENVDMISQSVSSLNLSIERHLDSVKKTSLESFTALLDPFQRVVREIARQKNKKIDLIVEGATFEVDKKDEQLD